MPKTVIYQGSLGLFIPIIERVIKIQNVVFFKLRMSFDGPLIRKKVLLEYSHFINSQIGVVVEVLEFYRCVAFEFFLDEEFIEFW